MHIITTTSQIVKVVPRSETTNVTLQLRNEQTKEVTTKAIVGSVSGNFMQYDLDFTCNEGSYYTFKLFEGSDLLYYGTLFCTDETPLDAYQILNGQYTTPAATDNGYTFANE